MTEVLERREVRNSEARELEARISNSMVQ